MEKQKTLEIAVKKGLLTKEEKERLLKEKADWERIAKLIHRNIVKPKITIETIKIYG